ncbi:hypothetical protein G6011_09712 [Alternaria panax]|uniref:HMG box domain-containing protein n=1 Tax=Alternaria panax TaxID=48097 RepID=A0AAD4FFI9_9PLEO|nr:hypothetical protein G6011_09712 [Alternaria panax]
MPQAARFLRRALLARNAAQAPAHSRAFASLVYTRRSYATTTRATKPTATVKKAVKTAAAKKPAPKKTVTTATKAAPKKPAATKAAARRKAKKPAAKKKAAPKKKPAKKVLTDEEKLQLRVRKLRQVALREPVSYRSVTALNVFVAENASGKGSGVHNVADIQKQFKNLTPAEREHWNHVAKERSVARRAEHQAFLNNYTPDQIRIANNARAMIRKLLKDKLKGTPSHTSKLIDERAVPRKPSAYTTFVKDRYASGDFRNIAPSDSLKLIANEWKALSTAEKQKYQDALTAA